MTWAFGSRRRTWSEPIRASVLARRLGFRGSSTLVRRAGASGEIGFLDRFQGPLPARAAQIGRQVTLLADGRPLATLTRPPYQVLWPVAVGTHEFTVVGVSAEGNEVEGNRAVIEVIE